jgi:hypothetical protein
MAITRRPKTEQERERQEQAFLAGAPDVAPTRFPENGKMQTVHLRFDPALLPRIDAAAKEMGLGSRAAWIRYAVVQMLKHQEK